jgi:hypothetical protein
MEKPGSFLPGFFFDLLSSTFNDKASVVTR